MKFYGIDSRGKHLLERVDTLPAHNPSDEGRILYDRSTDSVYVATNSQWVTIGSIGSVTASSVFWNGSLTGNLDSNVQDVIDKILLGFLDIEYDNSISGLSSTDIKSAIDELATSSTTVNFKKELFTLTSSDISNKYVMISSTPLTNSIHLQVNNGTPQLEDIDWKVDSVNSKKITWNGLGLDGLLISGDKILIKYSS